LQRPPDSPHVAFFPHRKINLRGLRATATGRKANFSPTANRSLLAKNDCCLPHAGSPSNCKIVLCGLRTTTNYAVRHPYSPTSSSLLLRGGKVKKTNKPTKQKHKHWKTPTRPPRGWEELSLWEIEAKYGLPSADRNNKATLLFTGPFRIVKSSEKDLIPLVLKLQDAKYRGLAAGA
jgi:hypothetical protein